MKKSIIYFLFAIGVMVLGSCSTNNFVKNTGRFNYVKSKVLPDQTEPILAEVSENSQDLNQDKREDVSESQPINNNPKKKETNQSLDNKDSKKRSGDIATNSTTEEVEIMENTPPSTAEKTKSFISAPSPKNTTKEKSQLAALLLCLILGMIGVHRFYLGKPLGGIIILLLTLVGIAYPPALILSGLIVLFDAIRLLLGGLGPGW